MNTNITKPQPVHTIRESDVRAAIWRNHGEKADFYNVTLSRMFKTEQDQLKDTGSFGVHDLTKAEIVLRKARVWIMEQQGD